MVYFEKSKPSPVKGRNHNTSMIIESLEYD